MKLQHVFDYEYLFSLREENFQKIAEAYFYNNVSLQFYSSKFENLGR